MQRWITAEMVAAYSLCARKAFLLLQGEIATPHAYTAFARYYQPTEALLLMRLLESPFLHVDETRISIQGVTHQVWVLTNGRHVLLRMTESRESDWLQEALSAYQGVLVSDFYPGYDAMPCRQQKCWGHLIRDLNADLLKAPYNDEFEGFVLAVRNLMVPILEALPPHGGLNRASLALERQNVRQFYADWIDSPHYRSEVTLKYQKRFARYRDSLFTMLKAPGVPWNNNTAERAIRQLAVQRKISGSFFRRVAPDYLRLLSIAQTCRFQGKSFLKFLLSQELDLDRFKVARPIRASIPAGGDR